LSNTLAGLEVRNTANLITPDTKICSLCFAPGGFGKTTFGASLDKMTKRFFNKPSLIIGVEAGEGGGTMSIQDFGVDFVTPTTRDEALKLFATLHTDTKYGGIVLDSSSEYIHRFLKPIALKFEDKEKTATRSTGTPARQDYQVMGEMMRSDLNMLINLTTHPNLNVRKHLFVTALQKDKLNPKGDPLSIHPDLAGAMADVAIALFQTTCSLAIEPQSSRDATGKITKWNARVLLTDGNGVLKVKDRTKCIPDRCEPDWEKIWEKYFIPRFEKSAA
jgi:hypothetical protein